MTSSPLLTYLKDLKNRDALHDVYARELSDDGVYQRFHRGDLTPTEAAKSLLDQVLGRFWHSIRIFAYDPHDDCLTAPFSSTDSRTVTLSQQAVAEYPPDTVRLVESYDLSEAAGPAGSK